MTGSAVHEAPPNLVELRALEQENTHLKDRLAAAADEIAKRDREIARLKRLF